MSKPVSQTVFEALAEPGDTFLLSKGKKPDAVYQAVGKLRRQGYTISRRSTKRGSVYKVEAVPTEAQVEETKPVIHVKVERHPSLGEHVRVTSLGEHPDGGVVAGLRDSQGRMWLAMLVDEGDL